MAKDTPAPDGYVLAKAEGRRRCYAPALYLARREPTPSPVQLATESPGVLSPMARRGFFLQSRHRPGMCSYKSPRRAHQSPRVGVSSCLPT
jgi:hypothetical protein